MITIVMGLCTLQLQCSTVYGPEFRWVQQGVQLQPMQPELRTCGASAYLVLALIEA